MSTILYLQRLDFGIDGWINPIEILELIYK